MNEDTQRVEIRDVPKEIAAELKIMAIRQRRSVHLVMAEALAEYVERHNSKPHAVGLDAVETVEDPHERRIASLIGRP